MTENSENPFGIGTSADSDLAGSCQIDLNDSGTCAESGTPLTQPCSGSDLDLTYENDRRALHHVRNRIDADSPVGHTYSNILELMKNWERSRPGDFCQQHIPRLLQVQERRLAVKALPAPPKMLTYQPEGV